MSLAWTVPAELESAPARLTLHDLGGRTVRTWPPSAGLTAARRVSWDGRDDAGRPLAPGLHVARLAIGERVLVRRLIRTR